MKLSSKTLPVFVTRVFLTLVVGVSLLAAPALADTIKVYGVEMPSWSKKVAEDRYESPRDWAKTIKHFEDQFKGWRSVRWHTEVNLPSVKYVHIENTNLKGEWSGINVYQAGDKVRVYVLKRRAAPPDASDVASPKSKTDK